MGAFVGCCVGVVVELGILDGLKLDLSDGDDVTLGIILGEGEGSKLG